MQSFTTGAILDTGASTTTVHEFGDTGIDSAPFLRYDVMFDVARGVVGFAPCHRTSSRRRLPVIESGPAS